jgi:hypothetical protein
MTACQGKMYAQQGVIATIAPMLPMATSKMLMYFYTRKGEREKTNEIKERVNYGK